MAAHKRPTIFVSSTCYDLRQVRADLKPFIEGLGCEAMLSEFNSFPVDPSGGTVANCIEVVRERADILVLVVGARYGSTVESGKSITNLEYLEARSKAIPVFVFVQDSIVNNLTIWRSNPGANFSTVVDSPKLFEFVASLMDKGREWVFPFKSAQDIVDTLRAQISYLFMDGLSLIGKVGMSSLPKGLSELGGHSLRLVLEQPEGWRAKVFACVLCDGINSLQMRKREIDWEVGLGSGDIVTSAEMRRWADKHVLALWKKIKSLSKLFNVGLKEAMEGDDIEKVVYVANRITDGYRELIDWVLECHRIEVHEACEKLLKALSRLADQCIGLVEQAASEIQKQVNDNSAGTTIELTVGFGPQLGEYQAEYQRLVEEDTI